MYTTTNVNYFMMILIVQAYFYENNNILFKVFSEALTLFNCEVVGSL